MPVERLDHYTIRTSDIEASRHFYTTVMGFKVGPRPPFNFPGLWLYAGEPAAGSNGVVHIIGVDSTDREGVEDSLDDEEPASQSGTGSVDHIAFAATGLADMRRRCEKLAVATRERTVPALGLHQLFLEDPNGVTIELNYPASEA